MDVLVVIQARGGSKRIPKKNIIPLAGKPLIAWTLDAAKSSKHKPRIIVSTDSQEIADVAQQHGAEVPFLRPEEHATDKAKSLPVLKHALAELKKEGYIPELVVQLKPTNPLRTGESIDKGIDLLTQHPETDSVMSVHETHDHPFKIWKKEGEYLKPFLPESMTGKDAGRAPKEWMDTVYRHNGAVNVIRTSVLTEKNSIVGDTILPLVLDEKESLNIDTLNDLKFAEVLL
ncbi:MAG: acylneuraminate cytidylyltransferase family protein [Candidatus Woesearchaeota archaeon]|jgi:N-acylneuraminate cytidylyltransferase|nr:acylneuraminate cytidylyltransferase family protein [Candidatus Woesearchaeota archaeon]MDP7180991.1 acylneuraminate cytidylyltransferase family protein [Candidatus Woesearchaeota archaeon]MDP7198388.1 acylneuraminate cytidylyltransferase family protein [Candidatus Woesearchaeota archaeon]MDP7467490.1 acylneuraminate cytidylyltransferase family protein [Candidatus Woesearchaeota archaeon]MDP7647717.1 acylneuraminate cytidylyltransferase family protein [Candidatus Woesearchaeota archaeon]|tara:strand:+ start:437 stop:1129 length:693 start_codon:yes stop_codon:yes gene_type:complete